MVTLGMYSSCNDSWVDLHDIRHQWGYTIAQPTTTPLACLLAVYKAPTSSGASHGIYTAEIELELCVG